jgi:hypothetical protein
VATSGSPSAPLNRRSSRYSLKWQFPRYKKFNGVTGIFETDKGNDFIVGHNLFIEAGLPVSNVRYVDLYLNNNGVMQRLEQGEFDGDLLDDYHKLNNSSIRARRSNPAEIYKVVEPSKTCFRSFLTRRAQVSKLPRWTDLQMPTGPTRANNGGRFVGSSR